MERRLDVPDGHVIVDAADRDWAIAELDGARRLPSKVPCCRCGGEVVEFHIDNADWNLLVRGDGPEHDQEYLCIRCFGAVAAETASAFREERDAAIEELYRPA
jgi:hypothetical protein